MKIAVPKETAEGERRVALAPESVKKLVQAGLEVVVQAGAGRTSYYADDAYTQVGAKIESDVGSLLGGADFVLKVQPPTEGEVAQMREGAMLLTTLLATRHPQIVRRLADRKITAFATDYIPRTTRAQSMDVLSSMANIAGYKAAMIGALELPKYYPMFMTAAGTVFPAKVFVIGAGVAGLQAVATARRLGATVEATDTRAVVKEQVESLGGKFVGVETTEDAQDAGGYAKELSKEFYQKQAQLIKERCAANDVVITTALIGGVKAPKLITEEMVQGMHAGAVIVDLAADAGGNCTLTEPGKTVVKHDVAICAPLNLPATMPTHASMLYGRNLTSFVLEFWKDNEFNLDLEDEIIKGAIVTHNGEVVHELARKALEGGEGS
jgi:NAD(P) transhydrogenase subunit alpha